MTAVLGQREDIPLRTVMEELGELKPHLENKTTLAYLLILKGMIALSQGDLEHSAALHEQSLELFRQTQDARGILSCLLHLDGIAFHFSLHVLACVAASQEQPVRAARLWGTVEGMQEDYGVHLTPITLSITDYEGCLAAARSQLDEEEQEVALLVARGLTNRRIAQELSIS
jgi:hypothetical protein